MGRCGEYLHCPFSVGVGGGNGGNSAVMAGRYEVVTNAVSAGGGGSYGERKTRTTDKHGGGVVGWWCADARAAARERRTDKGVRTMAQNKGQGYVTMGKGIKGAVEGNQLTLVIDLASDLGPSASGKSRNVATTSGNIRLPGTDCRMGLNVYKPNEQ